MPEKMPESPIDFKHSPASPTPASTNSINTNGLWQKAVAFLVMLIIAISAIVVIFLSQRLVDAQEKFATQQTAIVNQLITKIDSLQNLNAQQLSTLKESQARELKRFKQLQDQKLEELEASQTTLLESFKDNRDQQLDRLRDQMKSLPGAPRQDHDD
jgi:uncharacterized protein HemX